MFFGMPSPCVAHKSGRRAGISNAEAFRSLQAPHELERCVTMLRWRCLGTAGPVLTQRIASPALEPGLGASAFNETTTADNVP